MSGAASTHALSSKAAKRASGYDPASPQDNEGSWSKARYTPTRFTSGRFTVSFSLTARPGDHPVRWGVALWDDGPAADGSQFNEVNFGCTTDQSYGNTELRFESARSGAYDSLRGHRSQPVR
jgi:hypothetical protein